MITVFFKAELVRQINISVNSLFLSRFKNAMTSRNFNFDPNRSWSCYLKSPMHSIPYLRAAIEKRAPKGRPFSAMWLEQTKEFLKFYKYILWLAWTRVRNNGIFGVTSKKKFVFISNSFLFLNIHWNNSKFYFLGMFDLLEKKISLF